MYTHNNHVADPENDIANVTEDIVECCQWSQGNYTSKIVETYVLIASCS